MYNYNNQQQQFGYGNNTYQQQQPQQQQPQQQQQYGYGNNIYQQQQQQPPQQQFNSLQSQPTGYGFGTQLGVQQTGYQQQQQPLQSQATGWNQKPASSFQSQPPTTSFQSQVSDYQQPPTSFQTQPTGFQFQATGIQPQVTGYQRPAESQLQQQQQPLISQHTNWNQSAPPMTSFAAQPTGGLMSQATGYQQQPPTSFGTMPLQSQATGWSSGLQPQPTGTMPLTAQPTGFISNLADIGSQKNDLEIPNIRLSFISARDQERFETIFRNNVPTGENAMDGNVAKSILMKSGLTAVQLSNIWECADTNKSGSLMFPEFCVALHLANMARRGQSVPFELPTKIKNEVTGFVDAISFNIGTKANYSNQQTSFNTAPLTAQRTGLIPLTAQQTSGFVPMQTGMLAPQATGIFAQSGPLMPQQTGSAPPMTSFAAQPTGSAPPMTSFAAQPTGGFVQQQTGGFINQQTGGFMPQQTGFMNQQRNGLLPQQTGLLPQQTGLQPMITGKPGQWGFVSTPTGGLPGLDMMQSHFMPNAQTQASALQNQMGGSHSSNVTWAITKQEKLIYDNIFKQWDKEKTGFVSGDVALGVFTKSGLSFGDLEKIWTLCDQGNKGKLNRDEFAVAMHIIYRRLNGYDIPVYLPPELVPPSSKVLENTVDSIKNELKKQASQSGSNASSNVKQGISRSGTTYKNDDNSLGYVSNSRHRKKSDGEKSNAFSTKFSVDDLKKQIHEKKILLDAIDAQDGDISANDVKQKSLNEIELVKTKIKSLQSQLNSVNSNDVDSIEQKQELKSRLNHFSDKIPQLTDAIAQVDDKIKNGKIEIFRLKLQKENPSGIDIKGTGPNGELTETDKRIAKQKALLQTRMAKLTGKPAPNFDAFESNENKLNQEIISVTKVYDEQKSVVKDISASIITLINEVAESLNLTNSMAVGHSKWEKKEGVQNQEVADFIDYLISTKPAHKTSIAAPTSLSNPYLQTTKEEKSSSDTPSPQPAISEATVGSSKTANGLTAAEERAKRIKENAQKRMNERLARLGISRKPNAGQEALATETSIQTPASAIEPAEIVSTLPAPVPTAIAAPVEAVVKAAVPQPPPARSASHTVAAPVENSENSESEDDEEYKVLLAKKKEMEERKARKKQEKLAKLKAEMAALKQQADEEGDDEWDDVAKPVPPPTAVAVAQLTTGTQKPVDAHSNNPFASMINSNSETKQEEQKGVSLANTHNPFSKLQNNNSSSSAQLTTVDHEKLKKQRAAQMGVSNDDGWSDSDSEGSEDEMPTSKKQAELASMLFGGSSEPSRSSTYIPPVQNNEPVQNQKEVEAVQQDKQTADFPTEQKTQSFPPSVPTQSEAAVPSFPPAAAVESEPPIPALTPPVYPPVADADNLEIPSSKDEFYDAKSEESSFIDPTPPSSPETATAETLPVSTDTIPPLPQSIAPPLPDVAPPIPQSMAPSLPQTDAPPLPDVAPPPHMDSIPPPPPPPGNIPPPPPLAPAVTGGPPNIGALLGQITSGKQLKKVSAEEQHITSATVGRVI